MLSKPPSPHIDARAPAKPAHFAPWGHFVQRFSWCDSLQTGRCAVNGRERENGQNTAEKRGAPGRRGLGQGRAGREAGTRGIRAHELRVANESLSAPDRRTVTVASRARVARVNPGRRGPRESARRRAKRARELFLPAAGKSSRR